MFAMTAMIICLNTLKVNRDINCVSMFTLKLGAVNINKHYAIQILVIILSINIINNFDILLVFILYY